MNPEKAEPAVSPPESAGAPNIIERAQRDLLGRPEAKNRHRREHLVDLARLGDVRVEFVGQDHLRSPPV